VISSLNAFTAAKFLTLRTRLSPQECFCRLQRSTLPWSSAILVIPLVTSTLPLIGWVYSTGFAVRKRALHSNGMQPEAKASFVAVSDGTHMTVRLGTRRWVTVLNFCSLTFMMLMGGGIALLCRLQGETRCTGPSVFAMPFVIPSSLACILLFARWLARDEAAFLVAFLKQTLEAEEVPETAHGARPGRSLL
jgi:ABC-type sugar transport system permease subunit